MAFPTVAGRQATTSAAATSHTVSFDTTPTSGDLLVCLISVGGSIASDVTITMPSGWTALQTQLQIGAGSNDSKSVVYYKRASGEGASMTVTLDVSLALAAYVVRIVQATWSGTPEAASAGGGIYTSNPPSLTASWGSADNLWFAFAAGSIPIGDVITGYPTSYSNGVHGVSASVAAYGYADRSNAIATEDPAAFTQSTGWTFGAAFTVAVCPAPATRARQPFVPVARAAYF